MNNTKNILGNLKKRNTIILICLAVVAVLGLAWCFSGVRLFGIPYGFGAVVAVVSVVAVAVLLWVWQNEENRLNAATAGATPAPATDNLVPEVGAFRQVVQGVDLSNLNSSQIAALENAQNDMLAAFGRLEQKVTQIANDGQQQSVAMGNIKSTFANQVNAGQAFMNQLAGGNTGANPSNGSSSAGTP